MMDSDWLNEPFLTDAVNNATNIWKKIILNLTSKSVQPEFQVLHLSGFREWPEMTSQLARLIQFKSSRSVLSELLWLSEFLLEMYFY